MSQIFSQTVQRHLMHHKEHVRRFCYLSLFLGGGLLGGFEMSLNLFTKSQNGNTASAKLEMVVTWSQRSLEPSPSGCQWYCTFRYFLLVWFYWYSDYFYIQLLLN